jgi:hypothetical protein
MLNRQDSVPRSDGSPGGISIHLWKFDICDGEVVVWTIQRDWTQNNAEHVGQCQTNRRVGCGRS